MRWARIENNKVMEITDIDPSGRFVIEIEEQFILCDETVSENDKYENGVFSKPTSDMVVVEPMINPELADAYEAIAILSEQIADITSRLEAMSNV